MRRRFVIVFTIFLIIVSISVFFDVYKLPKGEPLQPPSYQYPLGTYIDGSNMINLNAIAIVDTLMFGGLVGVGEVTLALAYGIIAGVYGGVVRSVMVRFIDALNSLPRLPLLLSIALFYGVPTGNSLKANFFLTVLIVMLTGWNIYARQITELVYTSSVGKSTRRILGKVDIKLVFRSVKRQGLNLLVPSCIDGIATYTGMGVIGGVGDPNYPTLTTLLNIASHLLYDWWLFLVPAVFRGIVLVLLLILADEIRRL